MGKHLVQLYGGCSSGQKPGPTWDDHGLEDWKKPPSVWYVSRCVGRMGTG
ncbi:hypothetical protein HMPREF1545_02642 [Oscillibacter sp. KLE 1728]|nr:hypothetical protein HMPREF1545_02642 [Oscillibacter sp. KLE 1728]